MGTGPEPGECVEQPGQGEGGEELGPEPEPGPGEGVEEPGPGEGIEEPGQGEGGEELQDQGQEQNQDQDAHLTHPTWG